MIRIDNLKIDNNIVTADITAPLFWWLNFKGEIVTTNKMHVPLTYDDFSFTLSKHEWIVRIIINNLNDRLRDYYKYQNKELLKTVKELLPSAYNETKNVKMTLHDAVEYGIIIS